MGNTSELQGLQREFLEHVEIERGRSIKTIENYARYLDRFFGFSGIKKPQDITDEVVRNYRLWLNRQKNQAGASLNKRTQNYYLIALRSFLKFLASRNITSLHPERIELAKTTERELDLIDTNDLTRLLKAPSGNDFQALRDRAILELLFSTGLRVSELCSLSVYDVDFGKDEFSVRGKGGKVRVVFVSDSAKKTLKDYVAKRTDIASKDAIATDALFVPYGSRKSLKDNRLTSRSVERIVKRYAIKAGITKKVTPHILRHVYATDLLHNGADIRAVQVMLGHANLATTQIYTHVTDKQLRDVHQRFHAKR
jgi:site-specific recombinase XerD